MQRRRLLSALGASALPFAGCLGGSSTEQLPSKATSATATTTATERPGATTDSGTTDDSTTTGDSATTERPPRPTTCEAGESFETEDGRTVTVRSFSVQKIPLAVGTHVDPVLEPGRQFVVADVSVSDVEHLRDLEVGVVFDVLVDGERVEAEVRYPMLPRSRDLDRSGTLIGFAVPAPLDADAVAVAWDGYGDEVLMRWPLGDDCLDALAHPPEFEVRGFEVPDEVRHGVEFDATLTVANVGSGDGTFVAELGATTISDTPEVFVEVPAGETVTVTRTVDPHYPGDAGELTVRLNWGVEPIVRTVAVR